MKQYSLFMRVARTLRSWKVSHTLVHGSDLSNYSTSGRAWEEYTSTDAFA